CPQEAGCLSLTGHLSAGVQKEAAMAGGLFITLEGIDGSGKSTQAELLAQRLRTTGRETLLVREPGGTPVGECLRALLLDKAVQPSPVTEVLLYAAARAELVREVICPALS